MKTRLKVVPNDETGVWEIHDQVGYLCKLESKSAAQALVHAYNNMQQVKLALAYCIELCETNLEVRDDLRFKHAKRQCAGEHDLPGDLVTEAEDIAYDEGMGDYCKMLSACLEDNGFPKVPTNPNSDFLDPVLMADWIAEQTILKKDKTG